MNRATRKTVIAGNWKMNKTPAEAAAIINELKPLVANADWCKVLLCVPYVDISAATEAAKGTNIEIGAENMHWETSGAYTGEISADMLKALGVNYVIIGHSERRQYFAETDKTVNLKVKAALAAGLTPIMCVGETLEQRDMDIMAEVVGIQTKCGLLGLTSDDMKKVIIAYEPVWAIGTGRTATSEQADEACGKIRNVLCEVFGCETAKAVTIQYGGSMNAKNAQELLAKEHVDGGLIGGASLKAVEFSTIVEAANQ